MDVILTAGGVPVSEDPLFSYTQGKPKALLELGGKPMIQWTVDCLSAVKQVDTLVLVGLDDTVDVQFDGRLLRMESKDDMVSNIIAAAHLLLEKGNSSPQALVMASDIPTVKPAMVEWLIEQVQGTTNEITYTVVTKDVMEARFPGSHRSFIPLKDMQVCGGDVNAINIETIDYDNPIWRKLIDNRKNALKQAALLGLDTLLLILLRALTLKQLETRLSKRLGINGRVLVSPFAETAMDVDKPHQFEMIAADFRFTEVIGAVNL